MTVTDIGFSIYTMYSDPHSPIAGRVPIHDHQGMVGGTLVPVYLLTAWTAPAFRISTPPSELSTVHNVCATSFSVAMPCLQDQLSGHIQALQESNKHKQLWY